MVELSKDNNSLAKPSDRAKPTFITVGEEGGTPKKIIVGGRWNDSLMADYVIENGQDNWIKVGHLAKVGCGANTIPNKKRVRNRLSSLLLELLDRGLFLAIEYGDDYRAASAVKIANPSSTVDMQSVTQKINRMYKRKEMSVDKYERAQNLFDVMKKKAEPVKQEM